MSISRPRVSAEHTGAQRATGAQPWSWPSRPRRSTRLRDQVLSFIPFLSLGNILTPEHNTMLTRRKSQPSPPPPPEHDELDDTKSDLTELDIKSESDQTPEPAPKPAKGKRKATNPSKPASSGTVQHRGSTRTDTS